MQLGVLDNTCLVGTEKGMRWEEADRCKGILPKSWLRNKRRERMDMLALHRRRGGSERTGGFVFRRWMGHDRKCATAVDCDYSGLV